MLKFIIAFLMLLIAPGFIPLRAQPAPAPVNPKSIPPLLQSAGVVASLQWEVDGVTLDAIVTREGDGARLRIYERAETGPKLLLSDGGGALLVSLFTSCPSGCALVTVWASGRSRRIAIFAWSAGDLRTALDATSPAAPEFLADPSGAEPLVILKAVPSAGQSDDRASGRAAAARGFQADIFRWNGTAYTKVKSTAWKNRLAAVAALR